MSAITLFIHKMKSAIRYLQFFRDEQTRQVPRYLRQAAMRAIDLLSAARARPRTPDSVQIVHRTRHTTEAETTDPGAMRGAATEHG